MRWKESRTVDERMRLIARALDGERMTDVCREFGLARLDSTRLNSHPYRPAANHPDRVRNI